MPAESRRNWSSSWRGAAARAGSGAAPGSAALSGAAQRIAASTRKHRSVSRLSLLLGFFELSQCLLTGFSPAVAS